MSKAGGGFFVAGGGGGGTGDASATSQEISVLVQTASAAATSADAHASAASAAATSVDARVNTLSQAVSVISQQVSVLSQTVSVHSQRFSTLGGGATSTYLRKAGPADFQWEWGSVTAGGVGSVTSAQRDVLSNQISVLSVQAALVDGAQTELMWERVLAGTNVVVTPLAGGHAVEVSANISVTSNELSAVSAAVTSVDTHANTASAAATSVDARVNTISDQVSVLSQAVSVISQQVSALSQAHSALSQAHSALSQAVSVLSNANSAAHVSLETHASTASAAATSVLAGISAASVRSVGDISTHGLQSVLNALSNRICVASAAGGGSATPTSAAYVSLQSTVSHLASIVSLVSATSTGGGSATGLQNVVNALSNRISAIPGGASAPATRFKTVTALISATAMTAIPSLSVSVSAGGIYEVQARILYHGVAGSAQGFHFGLRTSANAFAVDQAAGWGYPGVSAYTNAGAVANWGMFDQAALSVTDSLLHSTIGGLSGTATRIKLEAIDLVGFVSATAVIHPTAGPLATTNTMFIMPGSFIRATKIN